MAHLKMCKTKLQLKVFYVNVNNILLILFNIELLSIVVINCH